MVFLLTTYALMGRLTSSLKRIFEREGGVLGCLLVLFWSPSIVFSFFYVSLLFNIYKGLVGKTVTYGELTGYRLKAALKIHVAIVDWLEEEEEHTMKGIRYDKTHDYVCKCDRDLPKSEQAIFKVRFLTAKEQAKARDTLYSVTGFGENRQEKLLTGTTALEALRIGLKGWENFRYEDTGEEIPFNEDNLSCIPPEQRDEIANYIRGISEIEV